MTLRDFYTRFPYFVGMFGLPPKEKKPYFVWETDGYNHWWKAERQTW